MTEANNPNNQTGAGASSFVKPKPWWLEVAWWARGATITIYPWIYSTQIPIPAATLVHEIIHWNQQKAASSRAVWFSMYACVPSFRKQVELEAFTSTIRYYVNKGTWSPVVRIWLVQELSGWTYLKMMDEKEASKWVDETVAAIRREGQ